MAANYIPDGYHTITPLLVAEGTAKLIDFIKQAFGAEEIHRPLEGTGIPGCHPTRRELPGVHGDYLSAKRRSPSIRAPAQTAGDGRLPP